MSTTPTSTFLSYNKFDKMDLDADSGDETQPRAPMLISSKAHEVFERDNVMFERFKLLFKTHLKADYPLSLRKLLARFIAVQHAGGESSNIYRYNDIMGLVGQVWSRRLAHQ